jgi:hypothetical protein
MGRVRGLTGINNTGTPNTKFDMAAHGVEFIKPGDQTTGFTKLNASTLTNDVAAAGPAAGGRDQAGAFSASSWIYFYYIAKDDGTVSTVSSAVGPATGPTLPATYTKWAFACAVRFNASSQLLPTKVHGAWATFTGTLSTLVNAGTATTPTSVNTSTSCPPDALAMRLLITVVAQYSGAVGTFNCYVGPDNTLSASNIFTGRSDASCTVLNNGVFGSCPAEVPGVALFYLTASSGTTPGGSHGAYIFGSAYKMPNGGE